jgi:hypothetical protein
MPERVELVFKREAAKEKPEDTIVRYLKSKKLSSGGSTIVYPDGKELNEITGNNDTDSNRFVGKIYGSYMNAFHLGTKGIAIVGKDSALHILSHSQVNRDFFRSWNDYPKPGKLWELLELLKKRTQKPRKFSGPPHLRHVVRSVDSVARESFRLVAHEYEWQAIVVCLCNNENFQTLYIGELNQNQLLCDTHEVQKSDLLCTSCGKYIPLFHPLSHGYDAAISSEIAPKSDKRKAKNNLVCPCGARTFMIVVVTEYDIDQDELEAIPPRKRNHAYGWFSAYARCTNCGSVVHFVDYECA